MPFPPLSDFGTRIMVLGPTNAGKSTFTLALANKLSVPAIHLDQYRHLPNTLYEQRPHAEFKALHDQAVDLEAWVIDGSYSKLFPKRLPRTTGIVVLDAPLHTRTRRYIWRTLFQKHRPGALEGTKDQLTLEMFRWLWSTRHALYRAWGLTKPHS